MPMSAGAVESKGNAGGLSFKVFGNMPDMEIVKIDGLDFVIRQTRTESSR
jgi:hypothetical protein